MSLMLLGEIVVCEPVVNRDCENEGPEASSDVLTSEEVPGCDL